MAGKETLVLKGLEATQLKLDEFLAFFPVETVKMVKRQIKEENELNVKEFDQSLGTILNLPPSANNKQQQQPKQQETTATTATQ